MPKKKATKSMTSYRFRLYPTAEQAKLIEQTFDATCWFYNQLLTIQKQRYIEDPGVRVSRNDFTNLVSPYRQANPKLKKIDSTALDIVCENLVRAYDNFFGKQSKFPKFHKRKFTNSYTAAGCIKDGKSSIHFSQTGNRFQIRLPKLKFVTIKGSRLPSNPVKQATITHESTGHYYVSVQVERTKENQNVSLHPVSKRTDNAEIKLTGKSVGLDINIPHLDFSDDHAIVKLETLEKTSEAKHLVLWERRLAHRRALAKEKQAQLEHASRQKMGIDSDWHWWQSKRYQEAKQHVARIRATQAHRRDLFFQRLTTQLIQEYDVIVVEDLTVTKMLKAHRYAKHISEISPNRFITMLEYKAQWHAGKQVIRVDPKNTTQTCHNCGFIMGTDGTRALTISDREWMCPKCHVHHNRDKNAAKNILQRGLATLN